MKEMVLEHPRSAKIVNRKVDAHSWIRSLGLEYYHVAKLRELRTGDTFMVSCFAGPGVMPDFPGKCVAEITKMRGKGNYDFSAVWTIHITKKIHSHILVMNGNFKLLPRNIVEFPTDEALSAENSFKKICRYAAHINKHARNYGCQTLFINSGGGKHHAFWRGEILFGENGRNARGAGPDTESLEGVFHISARG